MSLNADFGDADNNAPPPPPRTDAPEPTPPAPSPAAAEPAEPAHKWPPKRVGEWLTSAGLGAFAGANAVAEGALVGVYA